MEEPEERHLEPNLSPARILETVTAFWPAKVLLSAVELGLFTELARGPLDSRALAKALGIRANRAPDFLDCLVAMGFLDRDGDGAGARYRNTPETDLFLDRNKPSYCGGMPEMLNARLFGFWNGLTDALRTGSAQNESKGGGARVFAAIYADEARLEQFMVAMSSVQAENFVALAQRFDFSQYRRVLDVGGANALLTRVLATHHPALSFITFDLAPVAPIARREVEKAGLAGRIDVVSGDFLTDPLPQADVILMGNILHDWNEETKQRLIEKAFAALTPGGVLIAIENVIDDERRQNVFGLLMSLNMLIEFGADGGFDYTGAQYGAWCRKAGFARTEVMPLAGPASAAIAYKTC
jgi:predicted O-methyltransferase YrrM